MAAEGAQPVPIFCYPQGVAGDFGPREYGILERTGLLAALTGMAGYVDERCAGPEQRWQVPRFAYADSYTDNLQYVTGLERLKDLVRSHRTSPEDVRKHRFSRRETPLRLLNGQGCEA